MNLSKLIRIKLLLLSTGIRLQEFGTKQDIEDDLKAYNKDQLLGKSNNEETVNDNPDILHRDCGDEKCPKTNDHPACDGDEKNIENSCEHNKIDEEKSMDTDLKSGNENCSI